MVIRRAARILFFAVAGYTLLGALVAHLWWALDSGPLTSEPQLVLTDRPLTPAVRVYGDHPELDARDAARLTADALDDAGGFDRSVLVVTIPTGSGWVDPDQVGAFEDWASGDVATVAMRYSSAPSAAVYALRPEVAAESAHALLDEVATRLRALPADDRPRLVVHGLSLGAQAGQFALGDPAIAALVDVALWQGRPGAAERSRPSDPCVVTAVNPDDPVAALGWDLLGEPARALRVLAALPGSDSESPGIGHRYRPVLPPAGCLSPGP